MKINKSNEFEQLGKIRQSEIKAAGKDKTPTAAGDAKLIFGEDKLEFSTRAAEVGGLVDQLKNLPDVRQQRIDALREQIQAGDFNPSSEEIAGAILKDEN